MAEITTTQSFSDGDTVTATKLNNIQGNASIQPEAITNRTAEATIDQANDLLLIYDASATSLKKITPSNLIKAGTASDFPVTGNATIGGTLGVTGASTLTGNATIGGNLSVTGNSVVKAGTAASPAIQPTGDTNTGIFFPAADTIAFSEGGAESMRINPSGSLLIGTTSETTGLVKLKLSDGTIDSAYGYKTGGIEYVGTITNHPIAVLTNNAERLRIDSSGNVGIGTASPSGPLHIRGATGRYAFPATSGATQSNGLTLRLNDASDDNAILDIGGNSTSGYWLQATNNANLALNYPLLLNPNGGNVGIGISSPTSPLHVYNSANSGKLINIANPNAGTGAYAGFDALSDTVSLSVRPYGSTFNTFAHAGIALAGAAEIWADTISGSGPQALLIGIKTAKPLIFATSETERVRIDASGNLLVGATSGQSSERLLAQNDSATNPSFIAYSPSATFTGYVARIWADRNTSNSTYNFLSCVRVGSAGDVFIIRDSGNAVNTNNSYGAISDIKLKENIEDATSQWNDIKSIQVRKFSFKNDEEHKRMLGLVAQEVELISPNLVETVIDRDKDGSDLGTTTKEVKYSVLYMKAVKALQEAMGRIEQLESKVTALEAA